MKLKMVIATLVFGMAFCSSSYGFELLDRMMGRSGCGGCATSCCDTPVTSGCGCDAGTSCCDGGRAFRCHSFGSFFNRGCGGCGLIGGGCCGAVDAGCGCNGGNAGCCGDAVNAGCGCDAGCGNGCGLFSGLFRNRCGNGCGAVDAGCGCNGGNAGCCGDAVNAGCGCDAGCGSGCGNGCGLFSGLFRNRCGNGCGAVDAGCGCNGGNAGCCGNAVNAGCGCDNGCGGFGLLDRIRARHASRHCGGCCGSVVDAGCGCNGTVAPAGDAAPAVMEAPQSDAPVADPNAFIVPNRRIAGGAR